jgi:hypothetical protein
MDHDHRLTFADDLVIDVCFADLEFHDEILQRINCHCEQAPLGLAWQSINLSITENRIATRHAPHAARNDNRDLVYTATTMALARDPPKGGRWLAASPGVPCRSSAHPGDHSHHMRVAHLRCAHDSPILLTTSSHQSLNFQYVFQPLLRMTVSPGTLYSISHKPKILLPDIKTPQNEMYIKLLINVG